MNQLVNSVALLLLASLISVEANNATKIGCTYPFVSQYNGYQFNHCYYYAGTTKSFTNAFQTCSSQYNSGIVSPKVSSGQDDLYKLYKAFPDYYFWVGAIATAANPFDFRWRDGSKVYPATWCDGHPKGGDNLCSFYTTKPIIGRDKCIESGPCTASYFDHGIICQYGF